MSGNLQTAFEEAQGRYKMIYVYYLFTADQCPEFARLFDGIKSAIIPAGNVTSKQVQTSDNKLFLMTPAEALDSVLGTADNAATKSPDAAIAALTQQVTVLKAEADRLSELKVGQTEHLLDGPL